MKRGRWIAVISLVVLLATLGGSYGWVIQRTQVVPEFYQQAVEQSHRDLDAVVASLQEEVCQLQGDASRLGSWAAEFTDEQINGWLIQQLKLEFPKLLPRGVEDPRIVIEDGKFLAAARFRNQHIDTVISLEILVSLTEQPNVMAIQLHNLKAGDLPLPVAHFVTRISQEAAKSNLEIQWETHPSGPIALVTIPSDHPGYLHSPVIVESIRLTAGMLSLAGNTGTEARRVYKPQGPIYQLASASVPSPLIWGRNSIRHKDRSGK